VRIHFDFSVIATKATADNDLVIIFRSRVLFLQEKFDETEQIVRRGCSARWMKAVAELQRMSLSHGAAISCRFLVTHIPN
jgi:hypothetical protein